jgi:EpsI family protein
MLSSDKSTISDDLAAAGVRAGAGKWWVVPSAAWLIIIAGLAATFGTAFWYMWTCHWFPAWGNSRLGLYDRLVEGESYYTHAPLVPLVCIVMSYLLLRHAKVSLRPRPVLGGILLTVSLLLQLVACLAGVQFVQGFAFIGVVMGLVLTLWGGSALRRLWFPIAMLFFMMPLPPMAIAQLNFRLKMVAADWGVAIASAAGVPVARLGANLLIGAHKEMVVGNVCSGLRTLISLVGFGAVYVYVCKLRGWWRAGLFALIIPMALVSNCIRITSLIVVAHLIDVKTATGAFHDATGVLVFILAFLLMFGIEKAVLWARAAAGRPAKVVDILDGVPRNDDRGQPRRLFQAAASWPGIVAIILITLSSVEVYRISNAATRIRSTSVIRGTFPASLQASSLEYSSQDTELDEKTRTILQTDDYIMRRYEAKGSLPVDLCITYTEGNRRGSHPPDVCLEGGGASMISKADVVLPRSEDRKAVPCRELILQKNGGSEYYLYTYLCGNSFTSNWYWQQVSILGGMLIGDKSSGALIRLSVPIVDNDLTAARKQSAEFMQAVIPQVEAAVSKAQKDLSSRDH